VTTTIFLRDGISLMLVKRSSLVTVESLFGRYKTCLSIQSSSSDCPGIERGSS